MANWKSYKGQPPWDLVPITDKYAYNEGDKIATIADPVWVSPGRGLTPTTPIHNPCGYWFSSPGEGEQRDEEDNLCVCGEAYLHYDMPGGGTGYDSTMITGEVQNFTVINVVDGCVFSLELVGSGTLKSTGINNWAYTAKNTGMMYFILSINGEVCDVVKVLIICRCDRLLPFPAVADIQYTSLSISCDEQTTLYMRGVGEYCKARLRMEGVGDLQHVSGSEYLYTAPDANPDCVNVVISLEVFNDHEQQWILCNAVEININCNYSTSVALVYCDNRVCPDPCDFFTGGSCGSCLRYFLCSGYCITSTHSGHCACIGMGQNSTSAYHSCGAQGYNEGYTDLRTPADIAMGCCPPQLA